MLRKLSDLYREHGFITDHEVEKSKECLLCEDILAWKMIIERLDTELEEIRLVELESAVTVIEREKALLKKEVKRAKKEKLSVKVPQPKWKIFLVETKEGSEFFYRLKSKKKVQEEVVLIGETIKKISIIAVDEYKKIYLERDLNNYVSLEVLDKAEREGLLGKKGISKRQNQSFRKCKRKIVEEVMVYDGENGGDVITFCQPFEAKKTKKGNKIQLTTLRGSQAINPFDYVVKFEKRINCIREMNFISFLKWWRKKIKFGLQ